MKKLLILSAIAPIIIGGVALAVADPKVVICHHTSSDTNTWVTIEVAQSAVDAHVTNHGDTLGACVVVETPPNDEEPETPPVEHPAGTPPTATPAPTVQAEVTLPSVEIKVGK